MRSIKYHRLRRNMTQADLASLLNVSQTTVSKWESGVVSLRLQVMQKLASVFECTLDELLSERPPISARSRTKKS